MNVSSPLGVIAGAGALPLALLHACDARNIDVFVVAFHDHTDPALVQGRAHIWTRLGAGGHIIQSLKEHGVHDLVMIGAVRRPSLLDLRPDLKTVEFFARYGWRALGDDGLLGAVRDELSSQGFVLRGIQEFAQDLLMPAGRLGRHAPSRDDWIDIRRGLEVARALGASDVGQAVIVQEGIVLGVEAAEGTDALLDRCAALKRAGRKGVLVKTCKPQQDQKLDLPVIGPETLARVIRADLAGIVALAGQTLMIDRAGMIAGADAGRRFLVGLSPALRENPALATPEWLKDGA